MYSSDPFSSTPSDGCCSPISSSSGFLSSSTKISSVEETRALKLAFELTMAGASTQHLFTSSQDPNIDEKFSNNNKKSQNMTECVPVPSSEHVAEIVGRQGCKIKALRAKTNTYIKTPVRGEEPVFVVTGRKEDVGKAKREIISAAEHFSLIRASRKPAPLQPKNYSQLQQHFSPVRPQHTPQQTMGSTSITSSFSQPSNKILSSPGQTTIQVRVPYRVVGLVVGPKGATIKNIQNETQTYIVTPSRDKEPVFEVTGSLESVREAKRQIEGHIALRTGGGNFCMRDENETDHEDRFCGGTGNDLVNIWKNMICEETVDLPIPNAQNNNDIVIVESSSSGCSSSASTSSSSSSEKLKYKLSQTKKKECILCGSETESVNGSSTSNNSENNLVLCLECTTQVRSGPDSVDSTKYRYLIS